MSSGYHRMGANARKDLGWDNRRMTPLGSPGVAVSTLEAPAKLADALPLVAEPVKPTDLGPMRLTRQQAAGLGFTGNQCATCGSMAMVRNGTCEKCNDCGNTTGCS